MDTINNKIKEFRKANGFTQAYMADKMGISQGAYSQFENSESNSMRVSTLKNFCEVFNLDANWLLGIDENIEYLKKVHEMRNLVNAIQKDKEKAITMIKAMHLDNEDELITKVLSIDIQEG